GHSIRGAMLVEKLVRHRRSRVQLIGKRGSESGDFLGIIEPDAVAFVVCVARNLQYLGRRESREIPASRVIDRPVCAVLESGNVRLTCNGEQEQAAHRPQPSRTHRTPPLENLFPLPGLSSLPETSKVPAQFL